MSNIKNHPIPHIGSYRLRELTPAIIDTMLNKLVDEGLSNSSGVILPAACSAFVSGRHNPHRNEFCIRSEAHFLVSSCACAPVRALPARILICVGAVFPFVLNLLRMRPVGQVTFPSAFRLKQASSPGFAALPRSPYLRSLTPTFPSAGYGYIYWKWPKDAGSHAARAKKSKLYEKRMKCIPTCSIIVNK